MKWMKTLKDYFDFQVRGVDEYLSGETVLGEYEYVHTCMKFDEDVVFTLMHADLVKQAYLRTVTISWFYDDDVAFTAKYVILI